MELSALLRDTDYLQGYETTSNLLSSQELDSFLRRIYTYYVKQGYSNLVLSALSAACSVVFSVCFAFFLIHCVNWADFDNLSERYISIWVALRHLHWWSIGIWIVFVLYSIWRLYGFLATFFSYWSVRRFYSHTLRIPSSVLSTAKWSEITEKLVSLGIVHSELEVAQRIMRLDNFFLALYQSDAFVSVKGRSNSAISRLLSVALKHVFLGHCLDADSVLVEGRIDPAMLRRRMRLVGILLMIASPFVFIFEAVHFFFEYTETVRSSPAVLTARRWSQHARHVLRGFNELPHWFELRLSLAYRPARQYFDSFPSPSASSLAGLLKYVLGGLTAALGLITIIGDGTQPLLVEGGRSTIWYMSVSVSVLAVVGAMAPKGPEALDTSDRTLTNQPDLYMRRIAKITHFWPQGAQQHELHSQRVREAFEPFFEASYKTFLRNILASFVASYVLLFRLPKQCDTVSRFIKELSVTNESGSLCSFSLFELDEFVSLTGGPGQAFASRFPAKNQQARMEKSLLCYMANMTDDRDVEEALDARILLELEEDRTDPVVV